MELVEVFVQGIAVDKEREFPVVLLKTEDEGDLLPIWIGPAEATAIYMALAQRTFERPLTHDLLQIVIDVLGVTVSKIEITDIHNETYFARIVLTRGEEVFIIDARPSDAIALALRAKAPIFIEEALYKKYRRNLRVGSDDEADFREQLEDFEHGDPGGPDVIEE
jgi:bifunctional DNase/RNase